MRSDPPPSENADPRGRTGSGAHARRHAGDRGAAARGRQGRHRRARRAHRARLAPGRSTGRSAGDDAAPRQPRAARVSRRRRDGGHPRTARAGCWRRAEASAGCGPRVGCTPDDGVHVSAETSRRLACDATRVVMRHDPDGQVTEVGARTRTIPARSAAGAALSRRGLPFPGLRAPLRPGSSHQALGEWRPHRAVEPCVALSLAPPSSSRGRISDGATA